MCTNIVHTNQMPFGALIRLNKGCHSGCTFCFRIFSIDFCSSATTAQFNMTRFLFNPLITAFKQTCKAHHFPTRISIFPILNDDITAWKKVPFLIVFLRHRYTVDQQVPTSTPPPTRSLGPKLRLFFSPKISMRTRVVVSLYYFINVFHFKSVPECILRSPPFPLHIPLSPPSAFNFIV